jgi:hypothetical protein
MADQFIGELVVVTLRAPANSQISGVVAAVSGQQLTLQQGMPSFSQHLLGSPLNLSVTAERTG